MGGGANVGSMRGFDRMSALIVAYCFGTSINACIAKAGKSSATAFVNGTTVSPHG